MRILSNGNVGIGTINPTELLHLQGGDIQTDNARGLKALTNASVSRYIASAGSGNTIDIGDDTGWTGGIRFLPGAAEAMRILSNGNVGIGTAAPTVILEVACPTGFTNVKGGDNQLGCMQTAEANSGVGLTWEGASDYCFDNYGGRLPSTGEWYVTMANFALTDETDDYEWNNDHGGSADMHALSGSTSITTSTVTSDTSTEAFRCWIPR